MKTIRAYMTMKELLAVMILLMLCMGSRAELRTWRLRSGESIQGAYVATAFDKIMIRTADGQRVALGLSDISDEDATYVELANPPELMVDLLKSAEQKFVKPSPIWVDNSPVTILCYTFGARIRQKSSAEYNHELHVEIYAVARQVYDPDKYHLVCKWKSKPFRLDSSNGRRCEIHAPKMVELAEFRLAGEYPRGQEFAETMIVVRDERGMVIGYNATKNWLFENLDAVDALPEGAWFDKTCRRVHPTSPKAVWFD